MSIPFRIVMLDRDDLTDWDTYSLDDSDDMSDPGFYGWQVRPMGGIAFLVVSPDGEETWVDGVFDE